MNYPVPLPSLTPLAFVVVCLSAAAPVLAAQTEVSFPAADGETGDRFDVLGAAYYLNQHGAASISVVGGSLGGGAAGEAVAAAPEQFDRLVLLARAPIRHPEDLGEARKLFIVARGDTAQGDQLLTDIVRFLSAR